VPPVKTHDALVQVAAASVCGTDLRLFKGEERIRNPRVLGHDFSGVVRQVGNKVTKVRVGDRVAVQPITFCGKCEFCRQGRHNLCTRGKWFGFELDGGFAEYCVVPEDNLLRLTRRADLEGAAMFEAMSLGLHALDFLPKETRSLAILGQGGMGLVLTKLAKLRGLKVIAIDISSEKLAMALRFGADVIAKSGKSRFSENKVAQFLARMKIDAVAEVVGEQQTIDLAGVIVKPGGTLLFLGHNRGLRGPLLRLEKERRMFEVELVADAYYRALQLIRGGKLNLSAMISQRITLEELPSCMGKMASGELKTIKVVVKPGVPSLM
jgi:threonine dehydrogenase-like Zn-dependent dehydrogenase